MSKAWNLLALLFIVESLHVITGQISAPKVEQSSVVLRVGETLELSCEGTSPLNWTYPESIKDKVEISSEMKQDGLYLSTLKCENVFLEDYEPYSCFYENFPNLHTNVLVTITQTPRLLDAKNSSITPLLRAKPGETFTIPCRLAAYWRNKAGVKLTLVPVGSFRYEPHEGFIGKIMIPGIHAYSCLSAFENEEDVVPYHVEIRAVMRNESLYRPEITPSHDIGVYSGGNFTLRCTTEQNSGVFFNLKWTKPLGIDHASNVEINERHLKSPPKFKAHESTLRVFNASKSQSGMFECAVVSRDDTRSVSSTTVKVYDKGEEFLRLLPQTNIITASIGKDAIWVIELQSFPTDVIFTWFYRNHEILSLADERRVDRGNYSIIKQPNTIILKISSVDFNESGQYSLLASIPKVKNMKPQKKDLYLFVEGKPLISVKSSNEGRFYIRGQNYSLTCQVEGHPLPKVTWSKYCKAKCESSALLKTIGVQKKDAKGLSAVHKFEAKEDITYECKAVNRLGEDAVDVEVEVIDFPSSDGYRSTGPSNYIRHDNSSFECTVSKHLQSSYPVWQFVMTDADEWKNLSSNPTAGIQVTEKSTTWSLKSTLKLIKIAERHTGAYRCFIPGRSFNRNDNFFVNLIEMQPPEITDTNLNGSTVQFKKGDVTKYELYCFSQGIPEPEISWKLNGHPLDEWPSGLHYALDDTGQRLKLFYPQESYSGTFKCEAKNRNGTAFAVLNLQVYGSASPAAFTVVVLVIFMVVFLIITSYFVINLRRKIRLKRMLLHDRLEFEQGDSSRLNENMDIKDQAHMLPYPALKFEFPRSKLKIDEIIGAGVHGQVHKGRAFGIVDEGEYTLVAVKTLQSHNPTEVDALRKELKIMANITPHLNVVSLLGACTRDSLHVIVEYCKFGDLVRYIRRHKSSFISQINPETEEFDPSILHPFQTRRVPTETKPPLDGYCTLESINGNDPRLNLAPKSDYQYSEITRAAPEAIRLQPKGYLSHDSSSYGNSATALGPVAYVKTASRSSYQMESYISFKTCDLISWSYQIAKGMEHLASLKIVHGDLAARNVLLAENNVVKICDFGLSKNMYSNPNYQKKNKEGTPLPMKWMAPEAIENGIFSSQSDAWSFGVLMWELFSLGMEPYPGTNDAEGILKMVKEGNRLLKPPKATSRLYDIMAECWEMNPDSRPKFSITAEKLKYDFILCDSEYINQEYQRLPSKVQGSIFDQAKEYAASVQPQNELGMDTSQPTGLNYLSIQHKEDEEEDVDSNAFEANPEFSSFRTDCSVKEEDINVKESIELNTKGLTQTFNSFDSQTLMNGGPGLNPTRNTLSGLHNNLNLETIRCQQNPVYAT